MKEIFRNDLIVIKSTGHDYDFAYTIENLTNNKINFYLNGLDDYLELEENSWVGLLVGDYSDMIVESFINGDYTWNYIYGAK